MRSKYISSNELFDDETAMRPSSRPLRDDVMTDLFDYLDDCLEKRDCDHTFHHTADFLHARGIAPAPVVRWLSGLQADCDCEVLQNVELTWHALD